MHTVYDPDEKRLIFAEIFDIIESIKLYRIKRIDGKEYRIC